MGNKDSFRKGMRPTLFILLVGLLTFLPTTTGAQSMIDNLAAMKIGEYVGSNIQGAVNSAIEMRSSGTAASSEIDGARKQYWNAVKSGKGVESAGNEFRRQLWLKDLYYLMMAIPEGTSGPRATILHLITGGIDGGIRPEAQPYFEHWVKAIRVELGAEKWFAREETNNFVLPSFSALAEAMEATRDQKADYIRVRDWAEIDASGLTFPWDNDAKSHIYMILDRYGPTLSPKELQENYQELVELFGEKEVLNAGEKIRLSPRNSKGKIANPSAIGLYSTSPEAAFAEILATANGLTYFKYLIWQNGNPPAEAKKIFDFYTYVFDPAQIESAATKVLHAEKKYGIVSPAARDDLGISSMNPAEAIPELLANKEPLGEVKIVVAKGINCTSKEQFDKAFTTLLQRYGQEKLIRAHKAYYTHQKYQDEWRNARSAEQMERAKAISQEFEGKKLSKEEQQYHLLLKTLEDGILKTYAIDNLKY